MKSVVGLTTLAAFAVWAGLGSPDPAPDHRVRHVCKADIEKFCSGMQDPVKILECLQDHEQELGPDCASGLHRCPMYNCIDDIRKFCPATNGTKETLVCLWRHRSEISDKCWDQSIPKTKLGFLPEFHACKEDEHKFCSHEESLLGAMTCLQQPQLEFALSAQCSRIVSNSRSFACVSEAKRFCSDVTTLKDMKGCIKQHNLQCSPKRETETVTSDSPLFPGCEREAQQLCLNIDPKDLYNCLHDHEDSITKQCKKALKSSLEHICKEERISFCSDRFGQELEMCLNQASSVSMKCRRALVASKKQHANVFESHFSGETEPSEAKDLTGLNILLACLASIAFIVMLVGLAYLVRKSRSASFSLDSLPSTTTTTEYVRI